jgi:hypothetical protein
MLTPQSITGCVLTYARQCDKLEVLNLIFLDRQRCLIEAHSTK